jgi:tRNAThr (cytosine32-N3)-methyltransferase
MSALHPNEWSQAVKNIWTMLKPGGVLCFRDYGRNDLTQLRFKSQRLMEYVDACHASSFHGHCILVDTAFPFRPNLYARGDKTRVYFFAKEELQAIFSGENNQSAPSQIDVAPMTPNEQDANEVAYRFETIRLGVDRRLLMNRKRRLKMYRIWMQGIFRKPIETESHM